MINESNSSPSKEDVEYEMYGEKRILRKKMPAATSNKITYLAAKIVAKSLKCKIKDVLKYYSPESNFSDDATW